MKSPGQRAPGGLRGRDGAGPRPPRPRGAAADAAARAAAAAAGGRDQGSPGR